MRSNVPKNLYTVIDAGSIRIADVMALVDRFDRSTTLGQLLSMVKSQYPHKCPKCEGKGFEVVRVNTYPSGLPDSGWVDQMEDFNVTCDICNGQGFTKERLIAKPVKVEYVRA